jgi:site-specific recombinase XerD
MNSLAFASALAVPMAQFVNLKQKQGLDYVDQASRLQRFDRFLCSYEEPVEHLSRAIFSDYIASLGSLQPNTQQTTLSVVRTFSIFHNLACAESAVLSATQVPYARCKRRFFAFDAPQVASLMQSCEILADPIRQASMRALLGVLYATGLRIGEALALRLGDVDLARHQLHIRCGKNRRERLIILAPSSANALQSFLAARQRHGSTQKDSPLFLRAYDLPMHQGQAYSAFQRLLKEVEIAGSPPPRLHDLRHSYAMNVIARWRDTGADINALLAVLSTAMGHANIASTEYSLHASEDYLHASEDFTSAFKSLETDLQEKS